MSVRTQLPFKSEYRSSALPCGKEIGKKELRTYYHFIEALSTFVLELSEMLPDDCLCLTVSHTASRPRLSPGNFLWSASYTLTRKRLQSKTVARAGLRRQPANILVL